VVAMNTMLPHGSPPSEAFLRWRRFSQRTPELDVARIMRASLCRRKLTDAEAEACNAPFPSREFQTAVSVFPRLVPIRPDHAGAYENRNAIKVLRTLDIPVSLPWGAEDPITAPGDAQLRSIFGNVGAPAAIAGAGHFVQEDAPEEVLGFMLTQ